MKETKRNLIQHIVIASLLLIIVVCFFVSMIVINRYAKDYCFENIEETTEQIANMFVHTMNQNQSQLTVFSDVLMANKNASDDILLDYMENFCKTQKFSSVCIHRNMNSDINSGKSEFVNWGEHPHDSISIISFNTEIEKLPYTSDIISMGSSRSQKYIYQAVCMKQGDETVGILYGYISLDTIPMFISSSEYDGMAQLYIIDGSSGDYLLDEYHRTDENNNEIPLRNIFNDSINHEKTEQGYGFEEMESNIKSGGNGYLVFKSDRTDKWYYTYYMPMGINNWSMQTTIDEDIAFSNYNDIRTSVIILMVVISIVIAAIIFLLMLQNARERAKDTARIHKSDYISAVQGALISAHNNPDFVEQALKIIGEEVKAETVLLLTFKEKIITQAQYWPSTDKIQAMALIGINIRDIFPIFFDKLTSNQTVFFDAENGTGGISKSAAEVFATLWVSNITLVPIMDTTGALRGAIATVNQPKENHNAEMLECITKDFFMAIANLENHNIIKKMGSMDYLTGLKNRNSYEISVAEYEIYPSDNLWCIYVDVNGLHELNNLKGHKAGDLMLCTISDVIRKIFGAEHTYRLGGDEFLAFKMNSTHEEFMACKYRMLDEIEKKGYSVSAGFESIEKNGNGIFDVDKVVSAAEAIMYKDKRKYYEKSGISSDRNYI